MTAHRVHEVLPGLFRWAAFSPEHKVELSSHAIRRGFDLVVFDPISISAEVIDWFPPVAPVAIILTNENHARDAAEWRERFGSPIYAARGAKLQLRDVRDLGQSQSLVHACETLPLSGGPPGETAFCFMDRALVVFGDAIVNLPGRGLELLPAKYCRDHSQLRASVRHLLNTLEFDNAAFAHGSPLIGKAHQQIAALL